MTSKSSRQPPHRQVKASLQWLPRIIKAALLGAIFHAAAQSLPQTDTHRFDTLAGLPTPVELLPEAPAHADASTPDEAPSIQILPGSDQAAGQMAQQIGQLIRQRQWAALSSLLPGYETHPYADPWLVLYARGALYRHQKRYPAAIAAFSALLDAQPELHHVRMDLALMQMEDKQYSGAVKTFGGLLKASQVPVQMQQLAASYQKRLQAFHTLRVKFSSNYTRNDNVNQASAERILSIGGVDFVRSEDSMPKVGHGLNYGVRLRRMLPLRARHGLSLDLNHYGVHYWDQHGYSERSLRLAPAWMYQTHRQWLKVGPFYERNWLGGPRYGSRAGMEAEWGQTLVGQSNLVPWFQYANKHFVVPALWRYEGDSYRTGLNWMFSPVPRMRAMLGASRQWDVLGDKSESSKTFAVQAGGLYRAGKGIHLQANLQAGQRDFSAPHFLFGTTRRDRELSANLGLWHEKFSAFRITPKLVYHYRHIHSNLPALYSRKSHGVMVEIVDIAL